MSAVIRRTLVSNWAEQMSKVFPGSSTPMNFEELRVVQTNSIDDWDAKPNIFTMNGKEVEFFSIGQLGKALGNRSPNTLRAWEREGTLPKSPYVKPSADPRGRRRMYTRAMVEGIVQIAKEEKVFWPQKGLRISETQFTERVKELFLSLRKTQ